MLKTLSTPIKIAAFYFLVGGLLGFAGSFLQLIVSIFSSNTASLRDTISQLIQVMIAVVSGLYIIAGWFLMKQKRWSYILSLTLIIVVIITSIITMMKTGVIKADRFTFAVLAFILLIAGREDFKKTQ
jgi:hypothetical protein